MKILIIVPSFPPEGIGGTEIATYNIYQSLKNRNHIVHVLTSTLNKTNIECNDVYIHRIFYQDILIIGKFILWIKMLIKIWKIKPDIIHIQFLSMGFIGLISKLIFRKSFVVYARGSDVYYDWPLKNIFLKLVLRFSDAIVSLTNDMCIQIKSVYPRKVVVIPNGIDFEKFHFNKNYQNPNKKEKFICFVGNLRSVKGVKYLIESFKILSKDIDNIKLLIIGDGPEKESLQNLSKTISREDIIFLGKVDNSELIKYLNFSDIFVLPSLSEGFPNVILEAMSCGLPIIGTNIPGISEIVKDGVNGFLIEKKNSKMLAEKILIILKDDNLMQNMKNNNIKKSSNYSWNNVSKSLEEIYFEITD